MNGQQEKSFRDTLNLPTTDFEMRANKKLEIAFLDRWKNDQIYKKIGEKNKGAKKFILNDGPPYANGHIHIGTSLNKILKDIVLKYKRMSGLNVPFKLVWDCHGLPIELKVAAELGDKSDEKVIDPVILKIACRDFAQKWIEMQRKEFKELAVLADFDHIYSTMQPTYEADILRAFSKFVADGYIERKDKTVPWCASCQTVLAAAEIEYSERKDPSIFVSFGFDKKNVEAAFSNLALDKNLKVSFLVWTTTPWTLPLNRAVALNPSAEYALIEGKSEDQAYIVVKNQAQSVCTTLQIPCKIIAITTAEKLKGKTVIHPFLENLSVPIVVDDSVLTSEGTGVLHTAPGCGPDDYLIAVKNGIEIFSPLSANGKYTSKIQPKEFEGMSVADGQIWVLRKLAEVGGLVYKTSIKHSYPHCWRCHNGLIFRATAQWFCNLQKNDLIKNTLQEIEEINFIPQSGRARLSSTIASRTEWCISRQRHWGVPITAILCKKCDHAYLDADFINKIAEHVASEGIEYWDEVRVEELQNLGILKKDFSCSSCGNSKISEFIKEKDILDVWFDSGVSHFAVLGRDSDLTFPADLYLEGSDQHRGWFQSSLLSSMVIYGESCTKAFFTHGYVVDAQGRKMSKSIGNVISPQEVREKFNTDILRLWVASADYSGDIIISDTLLNNVAEVYRRIRNTCRFLLSNLYDFNFDTDAVKYENMFNIDRYALATLYNINNKILQAYEKYDFAYIFHTIGTYCSSELSAFYLDVIKDRLYTEKSNDPLRRSAQSVCYYILDTLTHLIAPILSFMAEEVSDFYQKNKTESIHLQLFSELPKNWTFVDSNINEALAPIKMSQSIQYKGLSDLNNNYAPDLNLWNNLLLIRKEVLKAMEIRRAQGLIKHPLEAKITIHIKEGSEQSKLITQFINSLTDGERERFLEELFIVSQVFIVKDKSELLDTELDWLKLRVDHADGVKCPRCWQWDISFDEDNLCLRCQAVLDKEI